MISGRGSALVQPLDPKDPPSGFLPAPVSVGSRWCLSVVGSFRGLEMESHGEKPSPTGFHSRRRVRSLSQEKKRSAALWDRTTFQEAEIGFPDSWVGLESDETDSGCFTSMMSYK